MQARSTCELSRACRVGLAWMWWLLVIVVILLRLRMVRIAHHRSSRIHLPHGCRACSRSPPTSESQKKRKAWQLKENSETHLCAHSVFDFANDSTVVFRLRTRFVNVSAVPSLDIFTGNCPRLRWNQAISCTAADLDIANNSGAEIRSVPRAV